MIACKQCQTQNGLDSKFCKNCGQPLSNDAIQEAAMSHEKTVKEGYALFNAGLTDDALLVAHAAVEENPNSPNAQSLLGMCFERKGQLAEALECFERVLTLAPDSALERMKISQLRNNLTHRLKTNNTMVRKFALVTGLFAMIVISAVGITWAVASSKKPMAASIVPPATPPDSRPFSLPETHPVMSAPAPAQNAPAGVAPNSQDVRAYTPPPQPQRTYQDDPKPARDDGDPPAEQPVTPTIIENPKVVIPSGAAQNADPAPASQDPAPTPDTASGAAAQKNVSPPPDDPGVIEITVSSHHNAAAQGGGVSEGDSPNQLQALMKTARNEFLVGRFDSAAKSYERALKNGGDSGTINQRLGMCYEKLGRNSEAAAAYNHAASSLEDQLNSGRGDSKRIKAALDSCKQAIKLLKG